MTGPLSPAATVATSAVRCRLTRPGRAIPASPLHALRLSVLRCRSYVRRCWSKEGLRFGITARTGAAGEGISGRAVADRGARTGSCEEPAICRKANDACLKRR
jgi:hypothetical protein